MKKTFTIAFLLFSTQAEACHHYSVWNYKTPQTCKESSKKGYEALADLPRIELKRLPKDIPYPPEAPVEAPSAVSPLPSQNLPDDIKTILNNDLSIHFIPNIPVDPIFEDPNRQKALDELKTKMH